MEDISRELEREIAKSRPKPFRKNRKIKILIVDDFGKVISGNHIKILFMLLLVISIVSSLTSAIFIYKYFVFSQESVSYKDRFLSSEKKLNELTSEKEVLMARLVILGKEPGIEKNMEKDEKPMSNTLEEKNRTTSKPSGSPENDDGTPSNFQSGNEREKSAGAALTDPVAEEDATHRTSETKAMNKTVLIEKFAVIRNRDGKDLLVRFDIRNISKDQKDVSGRIFTILKPDNGIENEWLVVPNVALKNGIPSEHQKGQYFSIAHFKPVKFRIKSEIDPDFYKKASIFIFSSEGELIFEKLIDITEAE
ncbi:MAG: hypothetical protein NDI81_08100 [Desulfobacula sp.]|nr:hypothetical protein [Desulfobacula sp.]